MSQKITIIKHYRGKDTLRQIELEELATTISDGTYQKEVGEFRYLSPLLLYNEKNNDGSYANESHYTKALPRICFAQELENRKGERVTKSYTGLVLLEVNNLTGKAEAEAVRSGAGEMPQTLMAFVGADGQSVKIVCRGELFPNDKERYSPTLSSDALPQTQADIALFHENLYERARIIYNGQLGVTIEKLEPTLQRICYMSADAKMVFHPLATPIYAKVESAKESLVRQSSTLEQTRGREGYERYRNQSMVFEFNLSKAYDDTEDIMNDDERTHAILSRLAQYCMETGLPMGPAIHQTLMKALFWKKEDLVRKVFENAYREDLLKKYREKKGIVRTKNIPPDTLMTMKVNIFLNTNYELRKNIMRGVAEYRMRTGLGFSFQDLTEEARNSITMRALEQGIKCWDKDIRRYVDSNDIERYDPMNEYLEQLPKWDGKDRVTALAQRIPTEWAEWPHLFHIWMRSMVAMWLGKGQLTGNALVPLLIGKQGCGKSSFCRILLPRHLQDYYNDRINFKNEQDLNMGLTSFGLINLDEFDKITQRQQIVLKYLVSTADLKYRPPYGKAYTMNRRYASFIGTTNEQTPLTDPTGSRRFLCVSITGDIDFETPVQHDQLYAQLMQEIQKGENYWLSKEEERALMEHNLAYQRLNGLGEMLMAIFQKPNTEPGAPSNSSEAANSQWMSIPELSALLKAHFKGYKEDAATFQKIGYYLNRPEYRFLSKHTTNGVKYWVKRKV